MSEITLEAVKAKQTELAQLIEQFKRQSKTVHDAVALTKLQQEPPKVAAEAATSSTAK